VFVQLVYQAAGEWPLVSTNRWSVGVPTNTILFNCPLWLAEYGDNPVCPPGCVGPAPPTTHGDQPRAF
jgi:hypothetical protein